MCGIVGIAAHSLNKVGKNIFSDLITVSNVRGRWGAGVATLAGEKIRGAKSLYSGCDLLDMKGFGDLMDQPNLRIILGHTRWPTKGGAEDFANVHPHFMTNITGVHNGTLDKVDGTHVKNSESDSVLFYKHADSEGFKTALSRTQGAYCFVFIDHATKTLNFIRNNQRPLFIGRHLWGTESQSLIWASEREMIVFAMSRANLMGKLEIEELPTNELWSISYDMKKGAEFEVTKALYGGSDFWRPLGGSASSSEKGWPFRGGQFRGTGVDRGANAGPSSSVGRETYVFRDGQFVAKSSILNPPLKQVSLRRSETPDEVEGKEEVRLPDRKGSKKGAAVQQRQKASNEVSLGDSGSTFVKNLLKGIEKHISKDEQEFNSEVESEFEKLLATKASEALWEDLQDDSCETTVYRETIKGVWIPEKDYMEILSFGCAWLGDPATDQDDIYWINRETFIFQACLNDKECLNDLSLVYPNDPLINQLHQAAKTKKTVEPQHVTMQ